MSRRARPLGEYKRAAAKLAKVYPSFAKYEFAENISRYQKAAIARVAQLPPVPQRTDKEWIAAAQKLSKLAPGLKKYKPSMLYKGGKLSGSQKAAISHKEKILRYSEHLIPLTKKEAKKYKDMLYAPGVRAIPMAGVGDNAKLKRIKKEMILNSNGRDWILWRVDNPTPSRMGKRAEQIFSPSFDLEKLLALAKKAFDTQKVIRVYLWSQHGIVGSPHKTLEEFTQWLYEDYSQYKNVERWVNGIAILIRDNNKPMQRMAA